jgi:hypothetical protein
VSGENRLRPASKAYQLVAGLIASLGLLNCAPSKVTVDRSPQLPKYRVNSVVVLPFDALSTPQAVQSTPPGLLVPPGAKRSDINVVVPAPPDRLTPEMTRVPPQAAEKVTQLVYEKLRAREGLKVLSPEDARRVIGDITKESGALSSEDLARKVAVKLGADAALMGRVLVYQERGGSKWGGEPATVGFEVKLIAADGTTLWSGNYYERQRPMTEDFVGFIERGGVFVTAEELAEYGAAKLVKSFPVPSTT